MTCPLSAILMRLERESLLLDPAPTELSGVAISGITSDSRFVHPGSLFCAVRGTAVDGHDFLGQAAAAGAVAALVERLDPSLPLAQFRVANGRRAAAFAAAEFYGDPWRGLTLIGVTGTNGKTTTVSILHHLLSRSGTAAGIGTLGVTGPDGRILPGTEGLTTPGPAQFAAIVRRLADSGVDAIAMEVSSHALAQDRVAGASFTAGIFTNLSRDHLDYHETLEKYRQAKLGLVSLIREGGVLAVNADDPAWQGVERVGVHRVRFGTSGVGEVRAERIQHRSSGTEWHLSTPSCSAEVHVPLFGIYNVSNALGAAAVLWGLGWTADRIAEGLSDVPQVPGRLERVPGATGPAVIIDFAHTPDALERALAALRPLTGGRLIAVFGAGGDRDRGKRPEMGRVAAAAADLSVITTDNPRHEDPLQILEDIESGMGDAPRVRIVDRREAIARAIELAAATDIVLLAGKGHETYQIWGDEKRSFDERVIVREILQSRGIGR